MIFNKIDIWNGIEKNPIKKTNKKSILTTYIMDRNKEIDGKKRPAILICPGGGYKYISEREAEVVALRFNAAGFQTFVLNYEVMPRYYLQPLLDASRAMCIIRENVEEWEIDENKIVVCGFSAGGHLAASLGVYWDREELYNVEGIVRTMNKPNGLILGYPVITSGESADIGSFRNLLGDNISDKLLIEMSVEKHISSKTPRSFLWHTVEDDDVMVENSLVFAKGLRENNIPFELHIYPNGCHGLALATEETHWNRLSDNSDVSTWVNMAVTWVKNL